MRRTRVNVKACCTQLYHFTNSVLQHEQHIETTLRITLHKTFAQPCSSASHRWPVIQRSQDLILPLDEGDTVIQRKQDRVDARVLPAELVELVQGLAALDPVGTDLVRERGIALRRDGHAAGERCDGAPG